MTLKELDEQLKAWLPIDEYASIDASANGIQVGDLGQEIRRVAVAVDACDKTFHQAVQGGADMLFVHHGLFWGSSPAVLTGGHYSRIKTLMENNLSLYAVHLPLDVHPELGNNISLVRKIGLADIQPFGEYRRKKIGYRGIFPEPLSLEQVVQKLYGAWDTTVGTLPFGPEKIRTVAVITGSAANEVEQAIDQGIDLFITGESSHKMYHTCLEAGIHVIFGGHYRTEMSGVRNIASRMESDLGLETFFIDIPTGL